MNLRVFKRIVAQRGWQPVALAMAGAAVLLAFAATRLTVYEAESRVKIEAARPADFGQTQAINGILRSYAADAVTSDMAHAVATQLDGWDIGALLGAVSSSADESTREVRIRFRHPDPAVAERVADVWARVFVANRTAANLAIDDNERVFASQRDATTHRLYAPRRKLLAAAGGAAGAALGVLLALGGEYAAAGRVRRPGDVAAVGPFVGAVPKQSSTAPYDADSGMPTDRWWGAARRSAPPWFATAVRVGAAVGGLAVLGAAAALLLSMVREPEYRSRARIAIEPARASDWGQTQAIREIMRGYGEDIATQRMAADVSERQQLDLPPTRVLELLSVAPNEDLYEIWIDVRHRDPAVAESVSRAWAAVFVEERVRANQLLDARDRIHARVREVMPPRLLAPQPLASASAGAIIGAMAGMGAVLAMGWHVLGADAATAAAAATGAAIVGRIPARPVGGAVGAASLRDRLALRRRSLPRTIEPREV